MADLQTAHIWGARFPSDWVLDQIFEERYGEDEIPITKFAESQGETFYDHDFFYVELIADRGIREVLDAAGIPARNCKIIVEAWHAAQMDQFEAIVVADEDDFSAPKSCLIDGAELRYLGVFPHWATVT